MESLPLIAGAVVLAVLILFLLLRLLGRRRRSSPAGRARLKPVLGPRELDFFRVLQRGLPTHVVMPAVGYARFLTLPEAAKGRGVSGAEGLRNHVVDFLVCDHQARPLAVVALGRPGDPQAEALLRDAAIPLLRYSAESLPTEQEIRDTFQDLESLGGLSRHLGDEGPDAPASTSSGANGRTRREPRL